MHNELLLEIGTEEIPAGFIAPALENFKTAMTAKFKELHLQHGPLHVAATPRRLAICVEGLADHQPDIQEEILGPPKQTAFDGDNRPTKAAIGFAKSRGAGVEDLTCVSTPKGEYLMLRMTKKGNRTETLLAGLLPEIILTLPFPKSMRWGSGSITFARPMHWIVALYNGKIVPFELDGIISGNTTQGHRFMAPKGSSVADYQQYLETLRTANVLVDMEERRAAVVAEINRAARDARGMVLQDDELVDIVTNLVEKPHAVCGTFEDRFLALPREVLITSMREHQKYFTVVNDRGELMPHFIAVNNTGVKDPAVAVEGHQRVLRARLEDALFFFNKDQQKTLADRVTDLNGVIFQAKLGTLLEKTERTTALAAMLAAELAPDQAPETVRAATLAKADLLTEMVNEFPSLQGAIGKEYALLNGESPQVAAAIAEHYMPVRAGSQLPASMPGRLVGLADRLDTITGCFGIGQTPTGTADPFGLRRLAMGLLHIIDDASISFSLQSVIRKAHELYGNKLTLNADTTVAKALDFIKGRFANDLISRSIPGEAIDAVTSVGFDDPADCRRKIDALVAISSEETFTLLAGAFKRVMNIIKDHEHNQVNPQLLAEEAEIDLHAALEQVTAEATPLLEKRDYRQAMHAILKMKEPVDSFFDKVLVMTDEVAIRANRLALLAATARLFLRIGDFSKMYGM